MMFDLTIFINACKQAVVSENAEQVVADLIQKALGSPEALRQVFKDFGEEEDLVHQSEGITIYHVRLSPGIQFPPHDHGMTAMIGVYEGEETNAFFKRNGSGLSPAGERTLNAGDFIQIKQGGIHSVVNNGAKRAAALHVYMGHLGNEHRSCWHPQTEEEHTFDMEDYFRWAK